MYLGLAIQLPFNWPGIGFALVETVLARDFPVVQFVSVGIAAFVIFANFVVGIWYELEFINR